MRIKKTWKHNKSTRDMDTSQVQVLLPVIWFISISCIIFAEQQPPLAKPGCPSKCGNITIPFPFGVGDSCSIAKWFTVDCNDKKNPFIKSIGLQLLDISLEGTARVNHPIASAFDGIGYYNTSSWKLGVGPFEFNNTANKFTGVGSNCISNFSIGTTLVGSCLSMCADNDSRVTSECNGIGCCQAGIPLHLTEFTVSSGNLHLNCRSTYRYSFLVDQQWFLSTIKYPLVEIPKMTHVPVVLNWGLNWISGWSASLASDLNNTLDIKANISSSKCVHLKDVTSWFSTFRCSCNPGYAGNPYLPQGCQDIDECTYSNSSACPSPMICQNLPGTYSCYNSMHKKLLASTILLDIGAALGPVLVLFGGWWLRKTWLKRKIMKLKEKNFKRNGGLLLQKQLSSSTKINVDHIKIFYYKELEKATDHFNIVRKLGGGGQGTVYKGMLADGRIVAVKKSKVVHERKVREFINEVLILSQISHRNVVRLLGCCLETDVPLLVYEFISNGTLYEYLHNQNDEFPLTWERRWRIAIEVASALSYLHSAAALPIYHRDIKSSNILLDEKYNAKIADFGISKSINIEQSHVTTAVQGTFGYLDPEYFQSNQFTEKSDVYSFGVVLVELLTGKKLATSTISEESPGLVTFFMLSMEEDNLLDILDAQVVSHHEKEEIMTMANLAIRCLSLTGKKRPTMKDVVHELERSESCMTNLRSIVPLHYEEIHEDMENETSETWSFVSDTIGPSSVSFVGSLIDHKILSLV